MRRSLALAFTLSVALFLVLPPAGGAEAPNLPTAPLLEPRPCAGLRSEAPPAREDLAAVTDLHPISTPAAAPGEKVRRQSFAGTSLTGEIVVVPISCAANCNGYNWVGGCRPWTFNGKSGCTEIECQDIDGNPRAGSCRPGTTAEP